MNRMRIQLIALAAVLVSTASGCIVSRTIVRIEDHPAKNATLLETVDNWSYVSQIHQFWQCKEEGAKLLCTKSCGAGTDLACLEMWGGAYSNLQ